jgi:hypothetical protein
MLENLVGKLVYNSDANTFRTGEVKAVVGDAFLIQFDCMAGEETEWSWPLQLVSFDEFKHASFKKSDETIPSYGFFETREELNRYVAWLHEVPSEKDGPKLVELTTRKR